MPDTIPQDFLKCSIDTLRQHCGRIETCVGKLTAEQVWARGSANENAIGNLVLHLCGNVRQWIIAGVGGASDVRQRDREFAARGGVAVDELLAKLRSTVEEAVAVLERVTAERLAEPLVIQAYDTTGLTAIYHVVEHFSGHAGQIVFATKMLTGEDLGFYRHLSGTDSKSQERGAERRP
jgi:uncharacterized damage-inducible protein DinB